MRDTSSSVETVAARSYSATNRSSSGRSGLSSRIGQPGPELPQLRGLGDVGDGEEVGPGVHQPAGDMLEAVAVGVGLDDRHIADVRREAEARIRRRLRSSAARSISAQQRRRKR